MRNVLILTRSPDPHMPPVAEAIRARGSGVICFNLADFPEEVALRATLDSLTEKAITATQEELVDVIGTIVTLFDRATRKEPQDETNALVSEPQ